MKQVKVTYDMTQKEIILKHLQQNLKQGISDSEARDLYGINRLGARIWDLKNHDGIKIDSVPERRKNRFGKRTIYARYTLRRPA